MKKEAKIPLPRVFIVKHIDTIFSIIFVAAILLSFLKFPLGSLLSGSSSWKIGVGMPWAFFVIDAANPEKIPIVWHALILDVLLYLLLAYMAEVGWNLFLDLKPKNNKGSPKLYKVDKTKL